MRVQRTEKTVYTFAELSDHAKEKARDWWRECENYDLDLSGVLDEVPTIAGFMGIDIATRTVKLMGGGTRQEPVIYWSGFSSQGDGACFEGTYSYRPGSVKDVTEYAPQDAELKRIVIGLRDIQRKYFYRLGASITHRGTYSHSRSVSIDVEYQGGDSRTVNQDDEETLSEYLRDLMDWVYDSLEQEYEYRMSDEQVDDAITMNEYEFDEEGRKA